MIGHYHKLVQLHLTEMRRYLIPHSLDDGLHPMIAEHQRPVMRADSYEVRAPSAVVKALQAHGATLRQDVVRRVHGSAPTYGIRFTWRPPGAASIGRGSAIAPTAETHNTLICESRSTLLPARFLQVVEAAHAIVAITRRHVVKYPSTYTMACAGSATGLAITLAMAVLKPMVVINEIPATASKTRDTRLDVPATLGKPEVALEGDSAICGSCIWPPFSVGAMPWFLSVPGLCVSGRGARSPSSTGPAGPLS